MLVFIYYFLLYFRNSLFC